jgi:hypothetical protein
LVVSLRGIFRLGLGCCLGEQDATYSTMPPHQRQAVQLVVAMVEQVEVPVCVKILRL